MAGAGYKLFNTGDVLTAQQVNEYLMQQTTMVFASAAARTSALSGVLAEGMVSYLQDTNTLEVYDGSSWVGATGDITGLTAGTGITISSATGPVPTITNSVATTFDALGDLVVGTGADTFAKLTVGANGESIVADSSTSTGLRYNPQPVLGNPFINGGFDFFQRSGTPTTGITVTGGYAMTVDRWWGRTASGAGSMVVSRQSAQDANLPNIRYCVRSRRATSNSDTSALQLWTFFETSMSIPFSGRAVTVSFYARKAAGFTGTFDSQLFSGTGTDQNEFNTGYTGKATVASGTHTLTTAWQRFAITGTISSNATELGFTFSHSPTGTAGSDDYYEVTGIQLDIGTYTASSAPAFRRAGGTLAGELAACQRYYWRQTGPNAYSTYAEGYALTTTAARFYIQHPVTMRSDPGSVDAANLGVHTPGTSIIAATNVAVSATANIGTEVELTVASGLTQYRPYGLSCNNNAAGYIGFSAEL